MAFVPHIYNPAGASEGDYPVPSYTASDASPHYYTIYSPVHNPHPHWQSAGPTYDVSYDSAPLAGHVSARLSSQSSELPLHAPAPLSGQASSLLTSQCTNAYYFAPTMETNETSINQSQISPPSLPPVVCDPYKSVSGREPSATRRPPTTFPTPSAMLTELSVNARPPSLMVESSEPKNETARKARRRAMAQIIGFEPTDPDVISSHEKKRHYLECLEYYVTYLHQQLNLVGCEPVRLERPATSTRGMSSQSIRTLLVHMEHLTRRLNQEMLAEEQRFIHLRGIAEQLQDSHSIEA